MSRLPIPGQDSGTWGDILNDYLLQAHSSDGTLKPSSVTASHLAPGSVKSTAIQDGSITTSKLANTAITTTKLDSSIQTSLAKADSAVQPADLSTVATTGAYADITGTPTLGTAASLDVGTTSGTVAAGDDSRITGAQPAATLDTDTAALIADPGSATRSGLSSTFVPSGKSQAVDLSGMNIAGYVSLEDGYGALSPGAFSLTPLVGMNITSMASVDGDGWIVISAPPETWSTGQSAVYDMPGFSGKTPVELDWPLVVIEMTNESAADITYLTWGEICTVWQLPDESYWYSYQSEVGIDSPPYSDYWYHKVRLSDDGSPPPPADAVLIGLAFMVDAVTGTTAKWRVPRLVTTGWARGVGSFTQGSATVAEGAYSSAEGDRAMTIGDNAHAEGERTLAAGKNSHAEGSDSWALGDNSHAEGEGGVAWNPKSHARGAGAVYGPYGWGQYASVQVLMNTTNATPTLLPSVKLWGNRVGAYEALISARRKSDGIGKAWKITAMVRTDSAGTVTVVNPVVTVLGGDAAAAAWTVDLPGGGTSIAPRVTGAASTTILWTAKVDVQEAS